MPRAAFDRLRLPSRSVAVPALILAAASWGVGTVVAKRAVAEIPPLTLLPIQLAASVVGLAVLMRARRIPLRDPAAPAILTRLGILNPGIAYALGLVGLAQITATLSVLLWATEPLMILGLAAWLLRERLGLARAALSVAAVAGMALVVYQPGSRGDLGGIALTLAGVGCCAVYTIVARRFIAGSDSTLPVVFGQQVWALAFAIGLAVVVGLAVSVGLAGAVGPAAPAGSAATDAGLDGVPALIAWPSASVEGWLSAIASGFLYYGLAYWLYLSALRRVPASVAATSFTLIPIFGVAAGFLLLGERLEPTQWAGAAVVLLCLAGILRSVGPEPDGVGVTEPEPARRPLPGR